MDEKKARVILRHVTAAVLDSSLRGNLLDTVTAAAREEGVELESSDRKTLIAVVEDLERFEAGNNLDELNAEIWSMGVLGGRMSPVPLKAVEKFPVDTKGGRMSTQKVDEKPKKQPTKKPKTKGGHMHTMKSPNKREKSRAKKK